MACVPIRLSGNRGPFHNFSVQDSACLMNEDPERLEKSFKALGNRDLALAAVVSLLTSFSSYTSFVPFFSIAVGC